MGIIRSLDALTSDTRKRADDFLAEAKVAGHSLYVLETQRTDEVQAAYCAQGRQPLAEVNALRGKAGLYLINDAQNKNKITDDPPMGLFTVYKGRGHGNGTAFDVVPLTLSGALQWNTPPALWIAIAMIAERCGLYWMGRWKPDPVTLIGKDPNHFQLPRPGLGM
jgi:peptidoglycan L-alanyl-D-glutamate endopeptidase CwlK